MQWLQPVELLRRGAEEGQQARLLEGQPRARVQRPRQATGGGGAVRRAKLSEQPVQQLHASGLVRGVGLEELRHVGQQRVHGGARAVGRRVQHRQLGVQRQHLHRLPVHVRRLRAGKQPQQQLLQRRALRGAHPRPLAPEALAQRAQRLESRVRHRRVLKQVAADRQRLRGLPELEEKVLGNAALGRRACLQKGGRSPLDRRDGVAELVWRQHPRGVSGSSGGSRGGGGGARGR
eukprot:scaffold25182_cov62-Phaeocystis_antarctica.AAC.13